MIGLRTPRLGSIAVLGAHCDDIAIGAGATLLQLCRANPGLTVDALVLTGGGTVREPEEFAALHAFCPGAEVNLSVASLPESHLPSQWAETKRTVSQWRRGLEPELVIAPQLGDAHQDHRLLAELVWQEFRNHQIWGYEILKYEGDLPDVQLHVPAGADTVREKVALLHEHYPSQHERTWFDPQAFEGLMRIRGVQCQQAYAEAFVTPKLVLNPDRKEDNS